MLARFPSSHLTVIALNSNFAIFIVCHNAVGYYELRKDENEFVKESIGFVKDGTEPRDRP